jgi:hypothetical protein
MPKLTAAVGEASVVSPVLGIESFGLPEGYYLAEKVIFIEVSESIQLMSVDPS